MIGKNRYPKIKRIYESYDGLFKHLVILKPYMTSGYFLSSIDLNKLVQSTLRIEAINFFPPSFTPLSSSEFPIAGIFQCIEHLPLGITADSFERSLWIHLSHLTPLGKNVRKPLDDRSSLQLFPVKLVAIVA